MRKRILAGAIVVTIIAIISTVIVIHLHLTINQLSNESQRLKNENQALLLENKNLSAELKAMQEKILRLEEENSKLKASKLRNPSNVEFLEFLQYYRSIRPPRLQSCIEYAINFKDAANKAGYNCSIVIVQMKVKIDGTETPEPFYFVWVFNSMSLNNGMRFFVDPSIDRVPIDYLPDRLMQRRFEELFTELRIMGMWMI